MADSLERQSPCKVNLLLNILGKRPDGFHELETILQPVNLCDRLQFRRRGNSLQLTCSNSALPTDSGNLVYRAAETFLREANIKEGLHIHLEKEIPLAAGLGGGSGNAAVTLLAMNELFGDPLPPARLQTIAQSLGSDVPFFLQTQPALATGRGEILEPMPPFPALRGTALLLIHPGFGISTAWAYQQLGRFPAALQGKPGRARELITLLQSADLVAAGAAFYNALEGPALQKFPLLALYQDFLKNHGGAAALMSGSGSTTFAVANSPTDARRLEHQLQAQFGPCWTTVVPI